MTSELPDYKRKIKTVEELQAIIGDPPRERPVVMCHGTFDLVHPGHIRHLMHARNKADTLIVSVTSDAHINKANFRPFVPQHLRAMNLAVLEVVDYVTVDDNPTPIENITKLKPDYFAKGYEYIKGGINLKTQKERVAVENYGGELVLTPGDVVYSSSQIIDDTPPDISINKLYLLMDSEGVTCQDLRRVLESYRDQRIHIVGDTIVDSYVYCSLISSGMTKTPTLSMKYDRQIDFVGGAAIVAKHMRSAGAEVRLSTVLGDDDLKDFVIDDLSSANICCDHVVDKTRPTTQKSVFVQGTYRVLKVDKLDNSEISDNIMSKFSEHISSSADSNAIVFSDFRHGIFSHRTIPQFISALPKEPLRVADSQVASRWGNILEFQDFDLITPNEREARFALGDQDSVIRPLALELYRRASCRNLILKMGERGIITYRAPSSDVRSFFTVETYAKHVVDSLGTGDALLAYATLGLAATGSSVIASILGSFAAAVACEQEGNRVVDPQAVVGKIDTIEEAFRHT